MEISLQSWTALIASKDNTTAMEKQLKENVCTREPTEKQKLKKLRDITAEEEKCTYH